MGDSERPEIGAIGWTDLTIENAEEIRDFCAAVTGWAPSPVDMGGYSDFNMSTPGSGRPVRLQVELEVRGCLLVFDEVALAGTDREFGVSG